MLMTFVEPLLDQLGPLLRRREVEDQSLDATNASIARLDERIAAQLDALALTGGAALAAFVSDDADHVLAVLAVWVASGEQQDHERAWQHVVSVSEDDLGEPLAVIMRHGSSPWRHHRHSSTTSEIVQLIIAEAPAQAAWLSHPASAIRRWAWAQVPVSANATITQQQITAACADPLTRDACIGSLCRRQDSRLAMILSQEVRWAARLAAPAAAAAVAARIWAEPLTTDSFAALADLGRPAEVERMIEYLAQPDPVLADAAGRAFAALTGANIDGPQRVPLPIADDEDPELAPQVWLPDQARARSVWQELRPQLGDAARVSRGFSVDDPQHAELSRSARHHLLLRRAWSAVS